jgi:hypothetical protein
MDDHNSQSAYADLGPTLPSTCSETPSRSKPPSEVRRLIGELGLRYRPAAQADLQAHAAAIALLACDVADVPPAYLERAIREWVRDKQFMPKASELIERAKSYLPKSDSIKEHWIARGNAGLAARGIHDAHWIYDKVAGQYRIEAKGAY